MRGRPRRIVMFVLGALVGLFFATFGYLAFAAPGLLGNAQAARTLLPIGGGVVMLRWLFLPLIFFGVDDSLDPARFALLPLRRPTLIGGMALAALAGVPAL